MGVREEILKSKLSNGIYDRIAGLPVLDYHCHLDPKEIYEDKPFADIGDIWLKHDHYKWRLMRRAGIDEALITGGASPKDKFRAFLSAVETAYGNPLRDWARLELSKYLGIETPLKASYADGIYEEANAAILGRRLTPKRIICLSNVEYIATTDDPASDLEYHKKLRAEAGIKAVVAPTFRVDRLFDILKPDFPEYAARIIGGAGGLSDFLKAIEKRAEFFKASGCAFSDIGLNYMPKNKGSLSLASKAFDMAVNGTLRADGPEFYGYLGFMWCKWLELCASLGFTAQAHIGVRRNVNSRMYGAVGADGGFDIVADLIDAAALIDIFNSAPALPRIIIYALNPEYYYPLITLADSFNGVSVGVPWWFNDHAGGINRYFDTVAELSLFRSIPGMTTDSRSLLSYARHDYFRMLLSEWLARFGEAEGDGLTRVAKALAYENMREIIFGGNAADI